MERVTDEWLYKAAESPKDFGPISLESALKELIERREAEKEPGYINICKGNKTRLEGK